MLYTFRVLCQWADISYTDGEIEVCAGADASRDVILGKSLGNFSTTSSTWLNRLGDFSLLKQDRSFG